MDIKKPLSLHAAMGLLWLFMVGFFLLVHVCQRADFRAWMKW